MRVSRQKPPRPECEIKRMLTPQRRTVMITYLFAVAQLPPLITKSSCHTKSTHESAENYAPTITNVTLSTATAITPCLSNQLNISIRTHQRCDFPPGMENITLPYYMKKGYKDTIPRITGDYTAFPEKLPNLI